MLATARPSCLCRVGTSKPNSVNRSITDVLPPCLRDQISRDIATIKLTQVSADADGAARRDAACAFGASVGGGLNATRRSARSSVSEDNNKCSAKANCAASVA